MVAEISPDGFLFLMIYYLKREDHPARNDIIDDLPSGLFEKSSFQRFIKISEVLKKKLHKPPLRRLSFLDHTFSWVSFFMAGKPVK
jgi:hypothetical protein